MVQPRSWSCCYSKLENQLWTLIHRGNLRKPEIGSGILLISNIFTNILNMKLSKEHKALFTSDKMIDSPILSSKIVQALIKYRDYPNNNSNRPQVTITHFIRDYFGAIPQQVQEQAEGE